MESEEVFSITKKLIAFTGIYFDLQPDYHPHNKIEKIKIFLKRYQIYFLISNMMLASTLLILQIFQSKNSILTARNTVPAVVSIVYVAKSLIVFHKKQMILDILACLQKVSRKMTTKKAKSIQFFLKTQKLMFSMYAFINCSNYIRTFVSNIIHYEEKKLIYYVYIPFDYQSTPIFVLLQVWCTYLSICGMIYSTVNDGPFYGLIIKLTSEMEELASNFENFDYRSDYNELKKLIEIYQHLLDISNKLASCFYIFNSITMFDNAFIICFMIFQSLNDQNHYMRYLGMIIKLTIWLFHVFFLCFYCQKLQNVNLSISRKMMMSNWYEAKDRRVIKAIQLTMMTSQQPVKLTLLKIKVITMESFTSVSD